LSVIQLPRTSLRHVTDRFEVNYYKMLQNYTK